MRGPTAGTAGRAMGLVRPYLPKVVASLVLAVAIVATTLLLPVLSGRAVDAVVGPHEVDFAALAAALRSMCVVLLVTAACQWAFTALTNRVVFGLVRDVRRLAFAKLQVLPLSYVDSHSHGDVVDRMVTDVDQLSNGLLMGFQQFFTGVLTILLTLVFMFRLDAPVAAVVVCVTPLSVLTARLIASRSSRHFRDQTARRGEMSAVADEMIGGMSSVEAFDMQGAACERFEVADEGLREASFKAVFFSSTVNPTTRFVNSLVYAGVGVAGAFSALAGGITVGGLATFLGYANQYTKPFNDISSVLAELQNSAACARRILELLDEPAEEPDAPDAVELADASGRVRLDDVAFSYVPDRPLIGDLSLDVSPGQRVAVVGPTGCGKTTLINLLMRFYDVDAGAVLVDGHDVRDLTRASLRRSYGMVLQDTWIKHATVGENIALGRPGATDGEIRAAARAAFADGFIEQLPHGYDTLLGDDAASLSAGQRQLLCIARVMLARPRMLILDEATSNIDTRTEACVQRAFDRLMRGRTSFVVAHRLSTVRDADVILVMRKGHVVERGTHEELLSRHGLYASIYESQFEDA